MSSSLGDMVKTIMKQSDHMGYESATSCYIAFLAKVDFGEKSSERTYDLLFELLSVERALLFLDKWRPNGIVPKFVGALYFRVIGTSEAKLKALLNIEVPGDLPEASWWALKFLDGAPGPEARSGVMGELYTPDRGLGKAGKLYGTFTVEEAAALAVPKVDLYRISLGSPSVSKEPKDPCLLRAYKAFLFKKEAGQEKGDKNRLEALYGGAPAYSSGEGDRSAINRAVGMMDVGYGGCNLVFDSNMDPSIYFDVGCPLYDMKETAPVDLLPKVEGPATEDKPIGPIVARADGKKLGVVLSHLDPDHWQLAAAWSKLRDAEWIIPNQPRGWVTQAFLSEIGALYLFPDDATHIDYRGTKLFRCMGRYHDPIDQLDNSGLAMQVSILNTDYAKEPVNLLMTGDAAFLALVNQTAAFERLVGATAPRHGAALRGKDGMIPTPCFPEDPDKRSGYLAYSYGLSGKEHVYGIPTEETKLNYANSWWGIESSACSTAEGYDINKQSVSQRGNIRYGCSKALSDEYKKSIFHNWKNSLFSFDFK